MKTLVFNAGSSSLKFGLFDMAIEDCRVVSAEFESFGDGQCVLHFRLCGEQGIQQQRVESVADIEAAIRLVPALLNEWGYDHIDALGHRVIHGGERFTSATLIDDDVLQFIQECTPLAPLHNPANLAAIYHSRQVWPDKPQVAVFDTAFHQTMPAEAYSYAIPKVWREAGIRRYGFHGTSHHYVALRTAQALQTPVADLRIISCHLGNGASVCAINRGRSVDTSMGMSPLEGLVMGTRSGDVDPGLFSHLSRQFGLNVEDIEKQLYTNSGLKALAGTPDLRVIEQQAAQGDSEAQLAIEIYAYRVRKYLGAYAAAMGGMDVVTFTGGIGENSATLRYRICDQLQFLGLSLDSEKNRSVQLKGFEAPQIASDTSMIKVIVTQTCEQLMIARETESLLATGGTHR